MRKPRLTDAVMRGLLEIRAYACSKGSTVLLGIPEGELNGQGKKTWADIETACDWIKDMAEHRGGR